MKFGRYASILSLLPGEGGNPPSRKENLVVYFSGVWEDLVGLLEAPVEFLRGQQFLWNQESTSSVDWQLIAPITATIECGLCDPSLFRYVAAHLGSAVFGTVLNFRDFGQSDLSFDKLVILANELTDEGSFFVEFATYTNSIRIIYFPPTGKALKAIQKRNGGPRYKGGAEGLTLISAVFGDESYANLHFDLSENSHRSRADFILGQMEAPDDLPSTIGNKAVTRQQCNLIEAGCKIAVQPVKPPPTAGKTGIKFSAGIDPLNGTKPQTDYEKFIETSYKYPTIIAHNLSQYVSTPVCAICLAKEDPKSSVVQLGQIIVESYTRILYDPGRVISEELAKLKNGRQLSTGTEPRSKRQTAKKQE